MGLGKGLVLLVLLVGPGDDRIWVVGPGSRVTPLGTGGAVEWPKRYLKDGAALTAATLERLEFASMVEATPASPTPTATPTRTAAQDPTPTGTPTETPDPRAGQIIEEKEGHTVDNATR